ncbi:hypothetical protein [Pleionea sediminis]|uniref:hypothetical protein n=1 Tax=Pleionea sediminis TaxID=2569479 RepID=UPI00118509A1|nr:hypothetical protein [Pleionea sediminis]
MSKPFVNYLAFKKCSIESSALDSKSYLIEWAANWFRKDVSEYINTDSLSLTSLENIQSNLHLIKCGDCVVGSINVDQLLHVALGDEVVLSEPDQDEFVKRVLSQLVSSCFYDGNVNESIELLSVDDSTCELLKDIQMTTLLFNQEFVLGLWGQRFSYEHSSFVESLNKLPADMGLDNSRTVACNIKNVFVKASSLSNLKKDDVVWTNAKLTDRFALMIGEHVIADGYLARMGEKKSVVLK